MLKALSKHEGKAITCPYQLCAAWANCWGEIVKVNKLDYKYGLRLYKRIILLYVIIL
jgi:hypothetical protein